ncbi:hypothetical protein PS906_04274 [Pseudomonas fluorescens]|nr:hypothetical protein PS906_04274 [Pseudomonas fluorescens]
MRLAGNCGVSEISFFLGECLSRYMWRLLLWVYPLLRSWRLRVPPLRRVTFSRRRKSNQKGLLLRAARSLGLGVPSLQDRSGRSVSGLLRCTSFRCVWLRQTVAALPLPDQSLRSAFRRRPWIKIKSCSRANAHPVEWGGLRRVRVVPVSSVGAAAGCDLLIWLLLSVGAGLPAMAAAQTIQIPGTKKPAIIC